MSEMQTDMVSDDILEDAELQEELVDETQVVDEDSLEEGKQEVVEQDDEDMDDSDEEEEDDMEEMEMPKTKAGVLAAAYDMLKKAKKDEAMALYQGMMKHGMKKESVEDGVEVVAEADVSHIDYTEELNAVIADEATLSEGFRDKAGVIFEAALKSKVTAEVERLEAEYAQNLEEEVTEVRNELVEKVDSYLNYVIENWMQENEVAVTNGLRSEIAEDFMKSLQNVFTEHYIEVPESKVDMFDELAKQVEELEESLNKSIEDNIQLSESVSSMQRERIISEAASDLTATEAEKFASLVEDVDFESAESFEMKVKTIKESFFKSEVSGQVDEADALLGEEAPQEEDLSSSMSRYSQILTKFSN